MTEKRQGSIKIDIFNYDHLIKANETSGLKEVSDPIFFDRGFLPTEKGLFSTEIFGRTQEERKTIYAYINLRGHFLHPHIYKVIRALYNNIDDIVLGLKYFSVSPTGELVEDPENGGTGLEWFYKNFDKIKFKESNSEMRKERLLLINNLKRDEIFITKFLVMPAYYRDVNLQNLNLNKIEVDEINEMYAKIIRLAQAISDEDSLGVFNMTNNITRSKLQQGLVDIYSYLTKEPNLAKKHGIIRRGVLGKSIDYGARTVISAPNFNCNSFKDMRVDVDRCGLPIAVCCTTYFPFVFKYVKDFFKREFGASTKYPYMTETGETKYVELDRPFEMYNEEYLKKKIDAFIKSYNDRFKTIPIPNKEGLKMNMRLAGRYAESGKPSDVSPLIVRDMTWTDLLYQACVDVTVDKHQLITRYPLEDYFGSFPVKVEVLSTIQTVPMYISDRFYPFYPKIDLNLESKYIAVQFIDTTQMSNVYLKGLGGD